jgi:hypothetical protein
MMKKILLATLAVFVVKSVLDFVMHVLLLKNSYMATAQLWRPEGEMRMVLMYVVTLLMSLAFVYLYATLIKEKGVGTGLKYGLLMGLILGISMGYGSYSVMPIPYNMAITWFLGSVVEATVGGIITGAIIK